MLKTTARKIVFGCALGLLAALFVAALESDFRGQVCEYDQATRNEYCTTYSFLPFLLIQIFKSLNDYGVAITALATVAIGAFTLTLKLSTDKLWEAAKDQIAAAENAAKIQSADMNESIAVAKEAAEVARQSLVTVQRAFVFIDSFQGNIVNHNLIVAPKWRNSGTTPTRFMTNWVNWKQFASEPPDDFIFPDLGEDGNPINEKDMNFTPAFVGPNATTFAQAHVIPRETLSAMRDNQARVFIWGWAMYQDVFGAPHVTKFCTEVKILAAWSEGDKSLGALSFPLYRRHNCTDEECDGEK